MSDTTTTDRDRVASYEEDAQAMLGVPLNEAFRLLDAGRLEGTAAEAELRMARFLLGNEPEGRHAA